MKLIDLYPNSFLIADINKIVTDLKKSPLHVSADLNLIRKIKILINQIQNFKTKMKLKSNVKKIILVDTIDDAILKIKKNNFSNEKSTIIESFERIKRNIIRYEEFYRKEQSDKNSEVNKDFNLSFEKITLIPTPANQNETPQNFTKKIRKLVGEGEVENAIRILKQARNNVSDEIYNQIFLLSARFQNNLKNEEDLGISESSRGETNQITKSLLSLLSSIEVEKKQKPLKD